MPPQLVVADAAYKKYPGGVIALRCTDWLASARGTLSTETDARAITGEAVRDEQLVTTSIWANAVAAYQEADDTLEIDFALLPIEGAASLGMPYRMLFSLLIEGDWDTSNDDTYRGSTQHGFLYGCDIGFHGVPGSVTDADPGFVFYKPRIRPHYVTVSSTVLGDLVGDEVLHVRAYGRTGTTIEILLDQIFLVPMVTGGGTKLGQWRADDFKMLGGQHNTFGDIGYDPPDAGGFVDGADGGDVNGKFTWRPYPEEENTDETGADGGGDYQKSPDEEYMIRVVIDDTYYLVNSDTTPDSEAPAHAYSLHGSNYREAQEWMNDDFSRTETSGWGTSPQGFGWWSSGSPDCTVDGSRGTMNVGTGGTSLASAVLFETTISHAPNAAEVKPSNFCIFSGTFEYSAIPTRTNPLEFDAFVGINIFDQGGGAAWALNFLPTDLGSSYPVGPCWFLTQESAETGTPFFGPVDVSGWFGAGVPVGFRIELKRYRLRVRIWDASGAEPGTWDYDDFPPWEDAPNPAIPYPYNDDLEISTDWGPAYLIALSAHGLDATAHTVYWDNIVAEEDPYGDPGDMTASIEQPNGTEIAQIDIPYGAWQMVYWGARDWTALYGGFPAYLSFSGKVWNESGAAELQRAEAPFYYFRSVHGGIISMNWSSALPIDITRVHG